MESTTAVLAPNGICGMCGMCDVTGYQGDTKGLLFSSIRVNIVLFSIQKSFVFKHLCKYCIVLDTQGIEVRKLSQQTHDSIVF